MCFQEYTLRRSSVLVLIPLKICVALLCIDAIRDRHEVIMEEVEPMAFVILQRRNPTAVRHRCAQRCDSENEHSAVTAMVRIVMLQR